MFKSYFKNIYRARYILSSLVKQDLKNRYRNSILGMAWTFLTPLGLVIIIGSIYSIVFGVPPREFIPYLFSGLIPWLYIVACADGGTAAFINAQGYIKQTQTPLEIFPIRVALGAFVNLIISIVAFWCIYFVLMPENIGINMLFIIPSLVIWIIFGCMWATIAAVINVYIRDFGPLQSLGLQGLFYATPIIYPVEALLEKGYDWVYMFNPLYYFFELIRKPLIGEAIDNPYVIPICLVVTTLVALIAIYVLKQTDRKIAFRI